MCVCVCTCVCACFRALLFIYVFCYSQNLVGTVYRSELNDMWDISYLLLSLLLFVNRKMSNPSPPLLVDDEE